MNPGQRLLSAPVATLLTISWSSIEMRAQSSVPAG
jgi:hypothetical protein